IKLFAEVIRSVQGVQLLHQDSGYAANRTVYTFAGNPEKVVEAAFRLYRSAWENITMPEHQGTHPRQGAVDVCPFIPLKDMSLEEAGNYATSLAKRLHEEIGVPGYFYEFNASAPERMNLAVLRKGEYEALPRKLDLLKPDFGNPDLWKPNGVTVVGARNLLVAYNVNLSTPEVSVARKIASIIRESGYIINDRNGDPVRKKGLLRSVKGIGWYIADFQKVQVSYNLTNLADNGILDVFLQTRKEAERMGCRVTGSELIGLAPLSEFEKVQAYLKSTAQADSLLDATQFLGLHELTPFDPEKKIIDYLLK
ncbi:MAG: glutamate formimidoyltransferase, partial [Owenweeksia sp.]